MRCSTFPRFPTNPKFNLLCRFSWIFTGNTAARLFLACLSVKTEKLKSSFFLLHPKLEESGIVYQASCTKKAVKRKIFRVCQWNRKTLFVHKLIISPQAWLFFPHIFLSLRNYSFNFHFGGNQFFVRVGLWMNRILFILFFQ